MKRRMCGYVYEQHEYRTDCGSTLLFRPTASCDKCGRKPYDKELDRAKSSRLADPLSDGNTRQGS